MSVSGLCEVCESAQAVDRCSRCGAFVCADHYDTEYGYCTDCASAMGGVNGDQPGSGTDTYQF